MKDARGRNRKGGVFGFATSGLMWRMLRYDGNFGRHLQFRVQLVFLFEGIPNGIKGKVDDNDVAQFRAGEMFIWVAILNQGRAVREEERESEFSRCSHDGIAVRCLGFSIIL